MSENRSVKRYGTAGSRERRRRRRRYRVRRCVFLALAAALLWGLCAAGHGLWAARAQRAETAGSGAAESDGQSEGNGAQSEGNSAAESTVESGALSAASGAAESGTQSAADGAASGAADSAGELSAAEKLNIIKTDPAYTADLVEFAQKYPQVIDYVYNYPALKDETPAIDLSAEAAGGTVPLLLQWDARWGYLPYSGGLIGYAGCGPTALSMAALYLTKDPQWSPAAVAALAEQNGYSTPGSGSSWTLISEGCSLLGLSAEELPLSEGAVEQALDGGRPVIAVVGPGDFTYSGHFLVLTGYDENGFRVNDCNSPENSARAWSFDTLGPQIRALWAMSKA